MKKVLSLIFALTLVLTLMLGLASCGNNDNNDDINKTFKHINTLSLKKIDENINRKRYNIQLRQVSAINLLKQTKNNTYRHLIRKHMHHKLDPIETNK